MTDRIDHAAKAGAFLGNIEWGNQGSDYLVAAQVHATLALVEQLRIGNLIALANVALTDAGAVVSPAEQQAWDALGVREVGTLRPDIAAALGLDPS